MRKLKKRNLAVAALVTLGVAACISTPANAATFNVKNYGAKGNGTKDDTAAIKKAITAAQNAAGANSVLFPAGTYLYSSDLVINGITLTGDRDPRRLAQAPTATLRTKANSGANVATNGNLSRVVLLKFATQSPPSNNDLAIRISAGSNNFLVQNCNFADGFGTGILIDGAKNGV